MNAFKFVVPVEWPTAPFAKGTEPTAWLDADGQVTRDRDAAQEFRFRTFPTMRDSMRIEERLDDINEGVDKTVDLELAITRNYAALRRKYEAAIWPEGRPEVSSNEAAREQEAKIDALYNADPTRSVLERMSGLRDRQNVAAEWPIMGIDLPPFWLDLVEIPLKRDHQEALVYCYMEAKSEAEAAAGK